MQNGSREELIRRYLEGEMSVAEEHDFLIDAAVDRDLRLELSAQQTIDRAFLKDRPAVDPELYGLLQQNVQGFLASTPTRRVFPSLRAGLITGLLILIGGLVVTLLPEGESATTRQSGVIESTEQVERVRSAEADPPTRRHPDEEGSIAVGSAAPDPERRDRPPTGSGQSISTAESPMVPAPLLQFHDISPPELPAATAVDDLGSMVRIEPERRLDSMGGGEPDSIRFNLKVEWDLPE